MKQIEIKDTVERMFEELSSLLSLYEETEGFQTVYEGEDARDYAFRKLSELKRWSQWMSDGAGKKVQYDGQPFTLVDDTKDNLAEDLKRVIEETEFFIKQSERPGVVRDWKKINQKLIYFDCAFDIMESSPKEYLSMRRGLTDAKLSCYPDPEMVEARKEYFRQIKEECEREGREYSEERAFQNELLATLSLVFEHRFRKYDLEKNNKEE